MGYVQYALVDYNLFIPIKMNIGIYIYIWRIKLIFLGKQLQTNVDLQ